MKCIFLDVETTGLTPGVHAIHQLSFQIYIDGQLKEEADFKLRPFDGALMEQKALDLKNLTIDQVMNYPPFMEAYISMVSLMGKYVNKYDTADKFFFYAYRADFDNSHMRAFFDKCGDKFFGSWFWTPHIDIMALAAEYLASSRHKMANFQLMTVAQALGIEINANEAHDSLYDIRISKLVYDRIKQSKDE